jgi:signal transduction histidine kinase
MLIISCIGLAFQNIEASGVISQENTLEFTALGASLGMMSKVLSDILDFNRMDAGRLSTVERPFRFHTSLKSMLPGARIVAESRGLELIHDFDPNIDIIARRTMLAATGLSEAEIQNRSADAEQADDGVLSGDEMRIRQVVTNLLSNAIKFNDGGRKEKGRVTLRTRLIRPANPESDCEASELSTYSSSASASSDSNKLQVPLALSQGRDTGDRRSHRRLNHVVVRIEIQDTGAFALIVDLESSC